MLIVVFITDKENEAKTIGLLLEKEGISSEIGSTEIVFENGNIVEGFEVKVSLYDESRAFVIIDDFLANTSEGLPIGE